jgi:hypothetical protein
MINIKTEFNKSNFNYDRTFDIVDVLPYNDEYIIQPNELSYYNTFNIKLSYLYDNFLYLYSRCSFPNFKIPTTFTGFIGVTGSNLGIYYDTNESEPFSNSGFSNIDDAKNAVVYKKDNSYYFFMNCLSAISVLRYDDENKLCQACPRIITTVDPISGELKFQKINSVSILEEKYLCVSDEVLDVVYKYDLESFFSQENIFKSQSAPFGNNLFLLDSVGGQGTRYDSIKFESPRKIPTHDNFILVEDHGNKIFKLFNSNFDFLSYTTFISLYNTVSSFESLKFKNEKKLYGIVGNGYYIFDIDLETYKININTFQSLSSILYAGEKILDIEFCKYDSDIIYILTDNGLIKKWENIQGKIIGRKNANEFGENSKFKWFTTSTKTISSDNIYIYYYNSNADANQILIYEDSLDLLSVFENDDFLVYSKDEIKIKKNEWNQAWVYEKSLKKLSKNLEILKSNICYNIIRNEGDFGSIVDIKKIYNNFVFDENETKYELNRFIGVNENFQSSVVNRELKKIHETQIKTLNFISLDNDLDYYDNIYEYGRGNGIIRFVTKRQMTRFGSNIEIYPFSDSTLTFVTIIDEIPVIEIGGVDGIRSIP